MVAGDLGGFEDFVIAVYSTVEEPVLLAHYFDLLAELVDHGFLGDLQQHRSRVEGTGEKTKSEGSSILEDVLGEELEVGGWRERGGGGRGGDVVLEVVEGLGLVGGLELGEVLHGSSIKVMIGNII